jgi:hypothetical protein
LAGFKPHTEQLPAVDAPKPANVPPSQEETPPQKTPTVEDCECAIHPSAAGNDNAADNCESARLAEASKSGHGNSLTGEPDGSDPLADAAGEVKDWAARCMSTPTSACMEDVAQQVGVSAIFRGLQAAYDVLVEQTRNSSFIGSFFVFVQLFAGLMIALGLHSVLFDTSSDWGKYTGFLLVPPGAFIFGSLAGLTLKWIMLAGLFVFGGITHLAGLAVGGTTTCFAIWVFVAKVGETQVHHVLEPVVDRVIESAQENAIKLLKK